MAPLSPALLLEGGGFHSSSIWLMVYTAVATMVVVGGAALAFLFFKRPATVGRFCRTFSDRIKDADPRPTSPTPEMSLHPDRKCVQRAALLSRIAYFDSPQQAMEEVQRYHHQLGFEFVRTSSSADEQRVHKIIFAVDSHSSTLFVCFRGTAGIQDLFTDSMVAQDELRSLDDLGALDGSVLGGFHRGFLACLNNNVPSMRLLRTVHLMQHEGPASAGYSTRRVVFCGHSLGGALAHLALIKYMLSNPDCRLTTPAIAIAFGGPHVCDATARDLCLRSGRGRALDIEARLFNFVNPADPVPFLLNSVPHATSFLGKLAARHAPDWIRESMIVKLSGLMKSEHGLAVAESVSWLVGRCLDQVSQSSLAGEAARHLSTILSMALKLQGQSQACEECKWYVPVGTWVTKDGIMQLDSAGEKKLRTVAEDALRSHRMAAYFHDLLVAGSWQDLGIAEEDGGGSYANCGTPQYDIAVQPNIRSASLDTSTSPITLTITGTHLEMVVKAQVVGLPDDVNVWQVNPQLSSSPYRFELKLRAVAKDRRSLLHALTHNPDGPNVVRLLTCFGEVQEPISTTFSSVESVWPKSFVAEAYFRCLWKVALNASTTGAGVPVDLTSAVRLLPPMESIEGMDGLRSLQGGVIVLMKEKLRPMVDEEMSKVFERIVIDIPIESSSLKRHAAIGGGVGAGVGAVSGFGLAAGLVIAEEGVAILAASKLPYLEIFGGLACLPFAAVGACACAAGAAGYYAIKKWSVQGDQHPQTSRSQNVVHDYTLVLMLTLYTLSGKMPDGVPTLKQLEMSVQRLIERVNGDVPPQENRIYTVQAKHGGPGTISSGSVQGCKGRAKLIHDILEADAQMRRQVKVVLVVGPENAGKSTLLNCILGQDLAETGHRTHTSDLLAFSIKLGSGHGRDETSVILVDSPGVDPEDQGAGGAGGCAWQYMEGVPELVFVVLPFTGDINELVGQLPQEVKRRTKCSKIVLVINRIDSVLNDIRKHANIWSEYSQDFMKELRLKYLTSSYADEVVMTVLGDENRLTIPLRDRLRDRGVLFTREATSKFREIIASSSLTQ